MVGALKVVFGVAALSTALGAGPVAAVGPEQRGSGGRNHAPLAQHGWNDSSTLRERAGAPTQTSTLSRARFDVDFDVDFDSRAVVTTERGLSSGAVALRVGLFGGRDRDRDRYQRHDEFACLPSEVAPFALDIDAYQQGDTIVLTARGSNRSGGFTTTLERVKHRGRTVVALRNIGPAHHHFATQALCAFELAGTLSARGCVETISVYVAGHERCIQVRQLNSIPRAW
ncbi:MAG: hypothetical protein ACT4PL_03175 [Phycisphaerales bacterium]